MDRRRAVIAATAWAALALSPRAHGARAQDASLPRIVFGPFSSPSIRDSMGLGPFIRALEDGLRENGLVDRKNIIIEYPIALEGPIQETLIWRLDQSGVAAFIAFGSSHARWLRDATERAAIVGILSDPAGAGLVDSLRRPGGRVTGTAWDADADIEAKNFELLLEVLPATKRIGGLWNPASVQSAPYVPPLIEAAARRGVRVVHASADNAEDIEPALRKVKDQGATGLIVITDELLWAHRRRIAEASLRVGLPSMWGSSDGPELGGLISYGPDTWHLVRRLGSYVARIIKGARPSDLPIELPSKFEMVINLRTAKALRLSVPQSVLVRADRVID